MQSPGDLIPRFIVGMPRASTTWLCQALNQHPDVAVFGESMFWGRSWTPPGANGRYDAETLKRVKGLLLAKPLESTIHISGPGKMKHIAAEDVPGLIERGFARLGATPTPGEVFSAVAAEIAAAEHKPAWIEKTPHHLLSSARILEQLPDARFAILIRDPYSFMLSYKFQPGYQRTAESRKKFEQRYHALAPAMVWRRSWLAAQSMVAANPKQAMIIRVEDIRKGEDKILRDTEAFFGLPPKEGPYGAAEKVNSSFDGGGAKPALSETDVAWMNLLAGDQIKASGYPMRASSLVTPAFIGSVVGLPSWALRFLADRRARNAAAAADGPATQG